MSVARVIPLSQKLTELIEQNAEALSKKWLETIRGHALMPTYQVYDEQRLCDRAYRVYSHLGYLISGQMTEADIARDYTELGAQRRREGFLLSEVIEALIVTRRVLWRKVEADGLLDTALDLYAALELNDRVTLFFDRAIFHAARGYEQATPK